MPEIEIVIDIDAPPDFIFNVLNDFNRAHLWNIVITEGKEIESGKKYFYNTNVGEMTVTRTETIKNKKIAMLQEGSPIQEMAYILEPKGDKTEAKLWGVFELEDQRSIMQMAGELLLKSLKVYVNFLQNGGKPEQYKKSFSKVQKA